MPRYLTVHKLAWKYALAFQRAHVPSVGVMPGRAALLLDCFLYAGQADLARKRSAGPALTPKIRNSFPRFPGPATELRTPASPALTRNPDHESSGRRPSFPL